jgi:TRAP-type C4-dicarboxylate transport system permease small subunit
MPETKTMGKERAFLLHRLSDRINKITEGALFGVILLMVSLTALQVIFRFFFQALTWSEELSNFLLVFASLLGAAVAFKRGSHIAVTLIVDRVPVLGKKILGTVTQLLGILFFGIVALFGAQLMQTEGGQLTPALQISMAWIYSMYPLCGLIILIHLVDNLVKLWERGEV